MSELRDNLQKELDRQGISPTDLARIADVPQPTIQRFLTGKHREIKGDKVKKIAKALGVSESYLRGLDNTNNPVKINLTKPDSNAEWLGGFDLWDEHTPLNYDEVALPFYREVKLSAGAGSSEVQENHGCKLRFARSTLKRQGVQIEHAYCVTVKGNSMEPVLPDGCTIGIDTGKTSVINGDWYAIDHHGELRVKVMYRLPGGGYRLRSFNSEEWPDESVQEDAIRVLGRIFWWSGLR